MFGAPQQQPYGYGQPPPGQHPQLKAAKLEMEAVTEMFQKMTFQCYNKCLVGKTNLHGNDSDLNVGELSCTDRCVGKYLEAQKKVGEVMNSFQQQQQQMQQAMAQQMQQQQ